MEFRQVIYQPGKVARIILNRPQFLNAQSFQLLEELDQALSLAAEDEKCGAIVVSGAGRAFSVGHDLGTAEDIAYRKEHDYSHSTSPGRFKKFQDMRKFYLQKTLGWRNLPKPTVAMVHGYCIFAGWLLAAAMDLVFAAEDAKLLPGQIQYFSAPWDLGSRKAKEILFEHRYMTATEAYKSGFVSRVFSQERLEEETLAFADRVAENYLNDPFWMRMTKLSINHMQDAMGFTSELESAYNNFYLMQGLQSKDLAHPDEGGFARTDVAKKNFECSRSWLEEAGLDVVSKNKK